MVYNQRDFRKDKPKPLRVRIVCGVKILTIFPKEKETALSKKRKLTDVSQDKQIYAC